MEYDFSKRKADSENIVIALTLDHEKMTERIIIGSEWEVKRRFEGSKGDVYYDKTQLLGSFLFAFDAEADYEWEDNVQLLSDSYKKIFPFDTQRWKMTAPVGAFLQKKCKNNNPAVIFAAIRTWEEYLTCFNINHSNVNLYDRLERLYRPFAFFEDNNPWQAADTITASLSNTLYEDRAAVELWYPVKKRHFEVVVASKSIAPMISYYLYRLNEWQFAFARCKVCNKRFIAKNLRYEICSDGCRKIQAAESRRGFEGRAKDSQISKIYDSAYFYWYNRIRKLQDDTEKDAAANAAFKTFRHEADIRKAAFKRQDISIDDFKRWIAEQKNIIDGFM